MIPNLLTQLWNDDCGALIATEFLFVATILVIGIAVGLVLLRDSVNAELGELANAILALSQGYTISGMSGCCSSVDGSAAIDSPALVTPSGCSAPSSPSVIDQIPCG